MLACLLACLPAVCLPTYLPTYQPTYLPTVAAACLPWLLPACRGCLPACLLPACLLPACLTAWCLPTYLPACPKGECKTQQTDYIVEQGGTPLGGGRQPPCLGERMRVRAPRSRASPSNTAFCSHIANFMATCAKSFVFLREYTFFLFSKRRQFSQRRQYSSGANTSSYSLLF